MRIETKSISDLKRADYNPRVELKPGMDEYERLKRSLSEFELVAPLVWNEQTGHLVGGHQRLTVLQAEGITEVPCVIVSLNLDREKALNVALNNERVGGRWDMDKLQDLLADLVELPDFDETLTGFNEKEFNELLMDPVADFETDTDDDPTAAGITVTLRVDPEDWESFRADLDRILDGYEVTLTIQTA